MKNIDLESYKKKALNHSYTYRTVDDKANQLARYLLSTQDLAAPEPIIALAVESSAIYIISLLAILKAGGC